MPVRSLKCLYQRSDLISDRVQRELLEGRTEALSGVPDDIFQLASVPECNTLVSWNGAYDERASQYVQPGSLELPYCTYLACGLYQFGKPRLRCGSVRMH